MGQSIHPTTWQLQSFVNNFDIQNSYVGNPQLKPAFNNRFFLNYEYMNLSKQEIFIFSTNWNKTNNYHSNSYVIDSLNNILNSTTNTFMNELNIALNYSRYFVKSKINIQNTLSFGYKNFEELINYIPNEISEKNILIKNSISIRPKDFLSIAYSSMILLSYHESSILKRFDGKNFIHNHSLINYIKLPQRFRFDLAYRVVSMPTDEEFVEDINIHNLDIKFSKSFLKANPMTFSFSIKNIFDNDKLFVKQLNSNYLSQRSSLHMRRLFAVGINWNLSKTL